MTITVDESIRRFLLHVLPSGFHRIRLTAFPPTPRRAANSTSSASAWRHCPANHSTRAPPNRQPDTEVLTGLLLTAVPNASTVACIIEIILSLSRSAASCLTVLSLTCRASTDPPSSHRDQ
ncbi:MAG: hypothetical protein IPF82_17770 [Blastocatellia bacterium]|nr:hypothetical protein [Blastocatellia bacterium]